MATVVDTAPFSDTTLAFNQRKVDRNQDGTLWVTNLASGPVGEFHYSKDNGATWTHATTSDVAGTGNRSFFIDVDDYAHLVWKQIGAGGSRSDGYIYYARGVPNAERTAWTWSAAVEFHPSANYNYPDVIAHREGTGWAAHLVVSYADGGGTNQVAYKRLDITSAGAITANATTNISANYGLANVHTYPSIDFNHTGDGKTVAGDTPHLYVGWTAGATGAGKGVRFRKAVYSAGSWTWNAEREIDPDYSQNGRADRWLLTHFDGTRAVIVSGLDSAGGDWNLRLYDRDAADTTTTTHSLIAGPAAAADFLTSGSASYDSAGNVYVFGRDLSGANGTRLLNWRKWTRSGATLGPITTFDSTGSDTPYISAKRGYSESSVDFVWTDGTASPFSVTFDRISLAPDVPTSLAPSGFTGQNTVTLSATVTDPQGDQVKAQFQVATDSGFTANVQSVDGSLVASGSTSSVAFTGTQNTTYYLRARGIDAGGNVGPYTASQTFTTNRPPTAPTVTAPNGGETINTTATVSWDAGSDPDGQALVYDVDLTTDGGTTWENLKTGFDGLSFTHDFSAVPASTACRVRARSKDTLGAVSGYDESDANFTIQHNVAPTAPLLGDPANGATADLAAGYTFTYTATDPDAGDAPSAWAFRRKVAGAAAYEYWNAGTGAWQSTVQWNTNPSGQVAFASAKWTNGTTYQWSVATKDTEGLEGPFAADFSVEASTTPTATVTAPTGSVTSTSRPLIRWTLTQPEGEPQQTYQVRLFSQAQYSVTGFDPATSTATWETVEVTSSGAREIQPTVDLLNQQTYRAYVRLKAANLYTAWASSQFSMALTAPRPPILALTDEPTSPFGPRVRIDLRMDPSLNLLTANQSSIETDTTGWVNGANATLARSTAQAFDGTASLSITAAAAGSMQIDGAFVSVVAGQVYTATAQFRAATTSRQTFLTLRWKTADGSFIAVVEGPRTADNTAGWQQARIIAQAPANAARCEVIATVVDCAASEVHYVDAVGLFATPTGNLVTNPDFENGTSGATAIANAAVSHSTAQAYTGRASLAVTASAAGDSAIDLLTGTPNGATITISAYVRTPAATAVDVLYAGTNVRTSIPANTWTRVSGTFTAAGNSTFRLTANGQAAGAVWYVDAVQVVVGSEPVDYLPPTTHNLVTNPSFEVNTAGWSLFPSTTLTRSTARAYTGAASGLVSITATDGEKRTVRLALPTPMSRNVVHTVSAYVYVETAALGGVRILDDVGGAITTASTAVGSWVRISGSTVKTYDLSFVDFEVTAEAVGTFYVDAVQVEQGSVATPYVDGSLGLAGGARWDASENLLSAAASSFEDGTTGGWVGDTGAPTLSNDATLAFSGAASLRATATVDAVATDAAVSATHGPLIAGQTYTWSCYVRVTGTERRAYVDFGGAVVVQGGYVNPLPAGWVRLTHTFTATTTGSLAWYIHVPTTSGVNATGDYVNFDAAQVEQRPYATAYAAPGTAHASTSTRQHRFEPGGFTQTMTYLVERSEDGGSVWTAVRNAEALDVDVQQRGVAYDYEPPRGQPVLYRASTVADV